MTADKKKKLFGLILSGILGAAAITMGVLLAIGVLPAQNIRVEREIFISTADELYELAEMSGYYDFSDTIVRVTKDITVNEGNAKDWAENAPARSWVPITGFAGTFDGQGHTISGLYGTAIDSPMALFAYTQSTAIIKDFHLENTYFESVGGIGTASISSNGGGSFERIYSNAIIECNGRNVAGMVSSVSDRLTIRDSQFDGKIHNNDRVVGGIIDCVNQGTVVVEHCLFSGTIDSEWTKSGAKVGGLVGSLEKKGAILNLTDCLSSGLVRCGNDNYAASVLGVSYAESAAYFKDVFGCSDTYSYVIGRGGDQGTFMGTPIGIATRYLKGYEGYRWTSLDFREHWAVDLDSTPVLQCFADEIPDLAGIELPYSTAWYDGNGEYTINNLKDLYGFYILSMRNDFEEEIIRLGADIVVNEGDAASFGKEEPDNPWFSIQSFAGIFDGQGHSISGIYVNVTDKNVGLFGTTKNTCTVKNLKLTNSYFYNGTKAYANMGSIAGTGSGTFDTIYSDAILYCTGMNCGGLIGEIKEAKEHTITNCWFDGEVHMLTEDTGKYGAGIVGSITLGTATMEHCLNTGVISSEIKGSGVYLGGLCSNLKNKDTKLTISDSLSDGLLQLDYYVCTGSIMGRVQENTTINFENVYATFESYTRPTNSTFQPVGSSSYGKQNGAVIGYKQSRITGNGGYQWTLLDFDKYWTVQKKGTPILRSFAEEVTDVSGLARCVDTSWYDAKEDTYILTDMADLYGFYVISNQTDFKDKTVMLGANITVNKGDAASWAKNAPAYEWDPIGTSAKPFAGVFDGRGHSISGLYMERTGTHHGLFGVTSKDSTVRNVSLKNTYFHSTYEKTAYLGSIAGIGNGNFDTIYSDAILVCDSTVAGGIVGQINEKGVGNTLNKCWFAGSLTMTSTKGANSGGLVGRINNETITTISHCLNTGKLRSNLVCSGVFQGGLLGIGDNGARITINDSLNTGTIDVDYNVRVGTVVGGLNGEKTRLQLANTYAAKQSDEYKVFVSAKDAAGKTYFITDAKGEYVLDPAKNPGTFNIEPIGGKTATSVQEGMANALERKNLTGANAYVSTLLNFKSYWSAKKNDTPVLKVFSSDGVISMDSAIVADTSWYNPAATEMVITNVNELYGLSLLAQTTDFAGKTIKLGANIMVNSGNAANWGKTEPEYAWVAIGSDTKPFSGTFDGQGYTISGLYIRTEGQYVGMFAATAAGSTVKNLRLENSYMQSDSGKTTYLGSIAGLGNGNLHTVYSNAVVVCNGTVAGGLVGQINTKGVKNTITNCQFDGSLTMTQETSQYGGGLVGRINNATIVEINNCLNSGTLVSRVYGTGVFLGGLVGAGAGQVQIIISDSVNTGTLDADYNVRLGTIVGGLSSSGDKLTITNTYAEKQTDTVYKAGGKTDDNKATVTLATLGGAASGSIQSGSAVAMDTKLMTGGSAYANTLLDFTKFWVAVENGKPRLLSFYRGTAMSLVGIVRADTSWYNDSQDSFVIKTAEELLGLSILSQNNDFAGKTILVNNDISLNTSDAAEWGKNPPQNLWTPIGSNSKPFAGTFNGQGNTISGIYVDTDGQYVGMFAATATGSTIENLRLENSYIKSDFSATTYLGSIAGLGNGNLHTVYSDAILICNGTVAGGLVGQINANGAKNTITNCQFDGSLTMAQETSQYGGGLVGRINNGTITEINNCLNSGTLTSRVYGTGVFLGGLVGTGADQAQITISDSVNTGTLDADYNVRVGTIVGGLSGSGAKLTVKSVYAQKQTDTVYKAGGKTDDNTSTVTYEPLGGVASGSVQEGSMTSMDAGRLTGRNAYTYTQLDFNTFWAAVENEGPKLQSFYNGAMMPVDGYMRVDTSWYDESKDSFVISNAAQLYGLSELAQTTDFAGKTILLENDITVNEGNAAEWKENAPENVWTSIGRNNKPFAGTFDGQGNIISGIYIKDSSTETNSSTYLGFFGVTTMNSEIMNFSLVNSYVESTTTGTALVGSIAGKGMGNFRNIYSDAIVVSSGSLNGGLIGQLQHASLNDGGKCVISNCQFDGEITAAGQWTGGITGRSINVSETTIEHCLFTGTATSTYAGEVSTANNGGAALGGIIGSCFSGTINIKDTLSTGLVNDAPVANGAGSVIGWNRVNASNVAQATVNIENVYALADTNAKTKGSGPAVSSGTINRYAAEYMTGLETYKRIILDYDNYWMVLMDSTPVLKSFYKAEDGMAVDLTWYNKDEKEYEISTAAELLGLSYLSQTDSFEGKTIRLTEDITINDGDASKWGAQAPAYAWTPIGNNNSSGAYRFKGTLDGQGNTISGIYVKGTNYLGLISMTDGGVVKNLSLINSYIESTNGTESAAAAALTGSIVGQVYSGTFENIYSDAFVVANTGTQTGGIIGVVNEGSLNTRSTTLSNCWFAGSVTGAGYEGGIIGIVTNSPNVTISNCLNSGSVTGTGTRVGGMVGYINGAATTGFKIEKSLNVGQIAGTSQAGYVIGNITSAAVTATNVYAVRGEDNLNTVASGSLQTGSTISKLTIDMMTGETARANLPQLFAADADGFIFWTTTDSTPVLKWKGITPQAGKN